MRAIVTVLGKDRVGITANVCALLAKYDINILDISQTILQEYFTMVMLVDASACTVSIGEMRDILERMDWSEGEGGRPTDADTSPSRKEAARREQAKRDNTERLRP